MAKARRYHEIGSMPTANQHDRKIVMTVKAQSDDIITANGKDIELPEGTIARLVVTDDEAIEIKRNKNLEVKHAI